VTLFNLHVWTMLAASRSDRRLIIHVPEIEMSTKSARQVEEGRKLRQPPFVTPPTRKRTSDRRISLQRFDLDVLDPAGRPVVL
jgi:hypothetical protein